MSSKRPAARDFAARFQGVYPAVPTPLKRDGSLDEEGCRRVVRYLLEGGVHGLWVLGSGGEFPAFSAGEQARIIAAMVDAAGGAVPVVAGVSATALSDVRARCSVAGSAGADAVFLIAPFYFHFPATDIADFFAAVADESPLPVVLYHNWHNSKVRLTPQVIEPLADHPNIVGLKDAGCDYGRFEAFYSAVGGREDFRLFQGDDRTLGASFLLGADGTVAAVPVIAPRLGVELYEAGKAGQVERAFELQRRCNELLRLYSITGSEDDHAFLATQKAALELLGLCERTPAPPVAPLEDRYLTMIATLLREQGLPVRDTAAVS